MILELFVFVFSISCLYLFSQSRRKPKGYPPGPFSLPILGNLLQIGAEPCKTVMKMRRKYGDIIAIDLGNIKSVWINDYNLLREAFGSQAFSGRCQFSHFADQETGAYRGIIFTSGTTTVEQRRFVFSYIQSGFRNGISMESLIADEIAELISDLKNSTGTPVSTKFAFNIPTINGLWNIITGKKYSLKDESFLSMVKYNDHLTSSKLFQALSIFPNFAKAFPKLSGYERLLSYITPIRKFMQDIIDDHKKTYKDGIERDFVDAYLHKIKTTTDPKSSFYGKIGEKNLLHLLHDLFMAGTETTSGTITWAVFLLAHYPEIQKKVINCIRLIAEPGKSISLKDRPKLPYVEAVIKEVMRFSSFSPIGLFHEATEDVEFHGYRIPKGTAIAGNQYGILHDPAVWGDPETFRPERFLDKDGTLIQHGGLVYFSVGRRVCPGEAFAKDEIFLFVTALFRNFNVEFDPSQPIPPIDYVVGHVLHAVPHKIVFHKLAEI